MTSEDSLPQAIKAGSFFGELENVSCPVCLSCPEPKLIFKKSDGVGIWQCPCCDIMYASPRFTEKSLLQIYENEAFSDLSFYNSWSYENWKASRDRSYIVSNLKARLLKRFLAAGARVLDVGCSTGLFCFEARKQGFDVEGIDPSKMLTETGSKALKIHLHHGSLEKFDPGYKFKGVVVWDVLEHVYNPVEIVGRCGFLMEPGGYLFLQVPNHEGVSNRLKTFLSRLNLKRSDFKHFGFPHHVYSFNKKSLSALVGSAGFKPVLFESWSQQLKDGASGIVPGWRYGFLKRPAPPTT